ncbi:MAG: hypothetical protein GXP53_13375 [Deltaproteobacteria bacterium]|nr:hypothetical protein [Deltaproteobacteria bacterium]
MKEKTDISKLKISEDTNRAVRQALNEKAADGDIPCASVFKVVKALGVKPHIAGAYTDMLELKLTGCQLGLFGYGEKKKAVTPMKQVPEELETAIRGQIKDGRLPCAAAWEIAANMGFARMKVSGACETMGVKVKPCQLGAF